MIWWEWQKWLDSRYKWTNTWTVRPIQQISTGARLTTNARFSTTKTHKHMLKAVVMIIIVLCPGFIFLNWDNHWSFCLTDIFIRSLGKKKIHLMSILKKTWVIFLPQSCFISNGQRVWICCCRTTSRSIYKHPFLIWNYR